MTEAGGEIDVPAADLRARYDRAANALPGRRSARTAELSADGYWVSPSQFFFVTDQKRPDSDIGLVAPLPFIADAAQGPRRALASFDEVRTWLEKAGLSDVRLEQVQYDLPAPDRLAIGYQGHWIVVDLKGAALIEHRPPREAVEIYSPARTYACFFDGHDLWLREVATDRRRPLTTGGEPLNAIGRQQENSLGPIGYRKRPAPVVVWSDDERWILTHQVDERHCQDLSIIQHVPGDAQRPVTHTFKMTAPGEPPPRIRLVAIEVATGRQVWSDPFDFSLFSPVETGAAWFSDGAFCYLASDRHFRTLSLREVGLESGADRELVREEAAFRGYLEPGLLGGAPNIRLLDKAREVVWRSSRDGYSHLYLYSARDGTLIRQLTSGAWEVRDLIDVDEKARVAYFTASAFKDAPSLATRRVFRISLDGGEPELLLRWEGDIAVRREQANRTGADRPFRPAAARSSISPANDFIVARYSTLSQVTTRIAPLGNAKPSTVLARSAAARGEPDPINFAAVAADDRTAVEGLIFLPSDFQPSRSYPVLDFIYPGPQSAMAPTAYASRYAAMAQAWAELGLAVVLLNSTGVPFRERAVRQAGYGDLLEPQLADHAAVLRQLVGKHPFLDGARIGMIGASGGGAATARALFCYPDLYCAGVSVCGNHDSRSYRSGWMDVYVGPDGQGEERHGNQNFASGLRGALMLAAGDMDDNVPLSQTLLVADALIKADKDFDLIIVPNEGHMVLATSPYLQRRVWDFLAKHLLKTQPPSDYHLTYSPEDTAGLSRASQRDAIWA